MSNDNPLEAAAYIFMWMLPFALIGLGAFGVGLFFLAKYFLMGF